MLFDFPISSARRTVGCAILIMPMLLAACFTSGVPALTADTAQDVGRSLTYQGYSAYASSGSKTEFFRFVREGEKTYRFELVDAESPTSEPTQTATLAHKVRLRRIATRVNHPVYLVQFDAAGSKDPDFARTHPDEAFTFFALSVDGKAQGSIALFDCRKSQLKKLAASHSLALSCGNDDLDYTGAITGRPASDDILAFITDALGKGFARWEDDLGYSLIDQVM